MASSPGSAPTIHPTPLAGPSCANWRRRGGSSSQGCFRASPAHLLPRSAAKPRRAPSPVSELPDKIAHPDSQGVGDDLKRIERHALASILQPVEMNAIETGEFGKLILRDSFLRTRVGLSMYLARRFGPRNRYRLNGPR